MRLLVKTENNDVQLIFHYTLKSVKWKGKIWIFLFFFPLLSRNHPIDMDVRIGFKLSKGEQEFLARRKTIVSRALKKVLKLRVPPWKEEVQNPFV